MEGSTGSGREGRPSRRDLWGFGVVVKEKDFPTVVCATCFTKPGGAAYRLSMAPLDFERADPGAKEEPRLPAALGEEGIVRDMLGVEGKEGEGAKAPAAAPTEDPKFESEEVLRADDSAAEELSGATLPLRECRLARLSFRPCGGSS